MWIVLTGFRKSGKIFGDTHIEDGVFTNQMHVYDRIEYARERKATIQSKWPHLKAWIVQLDYNDSTPQ